MEKRNEEKEKPKQKVRDWNFPSLRKTVKAGTYKEALKIVNRKEQI